jgi:hypothetical protein
MKVIFELLLVFAVCVICSCNVINPAEDIPAYIYIDEFEFSTNFGQEGSASQKISEIWVFADGEMMGAYDLPANIPVLRDGISSLSFRAGIRNNGIASTRIMYPFYEPFNEAIELRPAETDTVQPSYTYKDGLTFALREEFESQGTQFGETSASDVNLVTSEEDGDVFEGDGSGLVIIPEGSNLWQARSISPLALPAGEQMWVELNYKCNNTFAIGLIAHTGATEAKSLALIINPTTDANGVDKWNKIYVELSYVANQYINADSFDLYFECVKQEAVSEVRLGLDNVKLVHY